MRDRLLGWLRSFRWALGGDNARTFREVNDRRLQLEATLTSIGDAVITTDRAGRVTFLNPVAEQLTGWASAAAVGRSLDDVFVIVDEATGAPAASPVARVLESGRVVALSNHTTLLTRDGRAIPIDDSGAPIRDTAGRLVGVVLVFRDITERNRASQALRESEGRFRVLADSTPVLVWMSGTDARCTYFNKVWLDFTGRPLEQELGNGWTEGIYPVDYAHCLETYLSSFEQRVPFTIEYRLRRADGMYRWMLDNGTPRWTPDGAFAGFIGSCVDITERTLAERRLSAQYAVASILAQATTLQEAFESTLRTIVETINWDWGAIWIVDRSTNKLRFAAHWHAPDLDAGELVAASRTAQIAPGDSVPGRVWSAGEPVWIDDLANISRVPRGPIAARIGLHNACAVPIHIGGRTRGVLEIFRRSAYGRDDAVLAMLQAIGHRLAQFIELKRSEDTQRFLAEASAALAAALDYQPTINELARLVVPTLADWCIVNMLRGDGTVEAAAAAHVDPELHPLLLDIARRYPVDREAPHGTALVLRSGQPALMPSVAKDELGQLARDAEHAARLGELGLGAFLAVPLVARGRVLGALVLAGRHPGRFDHDDLQLASDLAWRAALAIDNARLYREAQQAIAVRDQFLSIAAHELKTPLTSMMGFAGLLQRRNDRQRFLSDRDLSAVRAISTQATRLDRLINLLLDLSRIETGHLQLETAPLDLRALARQLIDDLQPTLEVHRLDLSGLEEPLMVLGDPLRLEQVLLNLLQNAVKYSPEGGTVGVLAERRGDRAYLAVRDEGIGIPEEALPRLFTRFYRAPNVNPLKISGTGIGLYVVREIVERHGGTVTVSSALGEGSTFVIELPLGA